MKSAVSKLLVYGAVLVNISPMACNVANATYGSSMVEIFNDQGAASVPNVEPLQSGKLSSEAKGLLLFCTGHCKTNESVDFKIIQHDIPELFELNDAGDVVVAAPQPMTEIEMPKGHQTFVKITLCNIAREDDAKVQNLRNWLCLGVRKRGETEFMEHLRMPVSAEPSKSVKEAYVDMLSEDIVELVPLISTNNLSSSDYRDCMAANTSITSVSDFPIVDNTIKFSAVYRVQIENAGAWRTGLDCDMGTGNWENWGSLGVGPIDGAENQLVAINTNGQLRRSSDGVSWVNVVDNVNDTAINEWEIGVKYGNGVWCAINTSGKIRWAGEDGKNWHDGYIGGVEDTSGLNFRCLAFGNGVFMTADDNSGDVFASQDAKFWTKIGKIENTTSYIVILIRGNDKWICGDEYGNLYQSLEGKGVWPPIDGCNLKSLTEFTTLYIAGCFLNNYFYVVDYADDFTCFKIAKSSDGISWTPVTEEIEERPPVSITHYKNKLYAFSNIGTLYHIGLPTP